MGSAEDLPRCLQLRAAELPRTHITACDRLSDATMVELDSASCVGHFVLPLL
jgi:hypothetical protein